MYLFVGLGNIGTPYEKTPHNVGFMFVDYLRDSFGWSSAYDVTDWEVEDIFDCEICFGKNGMETKFIMAKPTTMMNLSGTSVRKIIKKYDIKPQEIVLAHDDLDIRLGEFKIQRGKSPKDHNGVNHVEALVGEKDFLRVRIGVDNRNGEFRIPGEEYVLKKYSAEEMVTVNEVIADSVKNLRSIIGM